MAIQMRKALAELHDELRYEPATQRIRVISTPSRARAFIRVHHKGSRAHSKRLA